MSKLQEAFTRKDIHMWNEALNELAEEGYDAWKKELGPGSSNIFIKSSPLHSVTNVFDYKTNDLLRQPVVN